MYWYLVTNYNKELYDGYDKCMIYSITQISVHLYVPAYLISNSHDTALLYLTWRSNLHFVTIFLCVLPVYQDNNIVTYVNSVYPVIIKLVKSIQLWPLWQGVPINRVEKGTSLNLFHIKSFVNHLDTNL